MRIHADVLKFYFFCALAAHSFSGCKVNATQEKSSAKSGPVRSAEGAVDLLDQTMKMKDLLAAGKYQEAREIYGDMIAAKTYDGIYASVIWPLWEKVPEAERVLYFRDAAVEDFVKEFRELGKNPASMTWPEFLRLAEDSAWLREPKYLKTKKNHEYITRLMMSGLSVYPESFDRAEFYLKTMEVRAAWLKENKDSYNEENDQTKWNVHYGFAQSFEYSARELKTADQVERVVNAYNVVKPVVSKFWLSDYQKEKFKNSVRHIQGSGTALSGL